MNNVPIVYTTKSNLTKTDNEYVNYGKSKIIKFNKFDLKIFIFIFNKKLSWWNNIV